jgi:photosystem II stability/assembly factor-like uncharacterized protein
MRFVSLLLAAALLAAQTGGKPRWRVKYFHDKDDTALIFTDVAFVSPTLGMAVGVIQNTERRAAPKGVALVTSDGGNRWTEVKLDDVPVSLFALDDGNVWMVGAEYLWKSNEFGRAWTKLGRLRGALRLHFLDEKRGFAAGVPKAVWQTSDGGLKWTKVPEAETPKTKAENTAYTNITFLNPKRGLISGFSRPPRRRDSPVPDWMDPDSRRAQVPNVTITLETMDGGKTWSPMTTSAFGQLTQIVFGPSGGLTVMEFVDAFDYPSEVLRLDFQNGKTQRSFREPDRAVKDVAIDKLGRGLLAAIERKGQMGHLPIPGRLRIYESLDLLKWGEMDVDYKAVANSVKLATGDARFAVTDTGMILKYE